MKKSNNSEKDTFKVELVPKKRLEMAREYPTSPPGIILKAAENVFAEMGYNGATTREIARKSNVNIANIHYYWGSKDELWHAVIYNVMMQIVELSKSLKEIPSDNIEEGLKNIIGKFIDIFADNPNYARILQQGTVGVYADEIAKDLNLPLLNIGLSFIKDNIGENLSPDFDPALVLFSLTGALTIFFTEQDTASVIFGEDSSSFSPAFRQKLKKTLFFIMSRVIGIDEK